MTNGGDEGDTSSSSSLAQLCLQRKDPGDDLLLSTIFVSRLFFLLSLSSCPSSADLTMANLTESCIEEHYIYRQFPRITTILQIK